jgi:adenylate cyclase
VASEGAEPRGWRERARELDHDPRLVRAARWVRDRLPGDREFGDPLSTAGNEGPQTVGRRLATLTEERPGVLREVGLGALQVWQSVSEAQGRGRGDEELAIGFTDLEGFSEFALEAGDERAVALLREVGHTVEPVVRGAGGSVVKRLGDGMMVVFDDARSGVDALRESCTLVGSLSVDGADYTPCMRAGLHVGRPRRLGGDYLGVDVNIAARLADEAGGGELLVSDVVAETLGDDGGYEVRRRRRFKVKGVPRDLAAYAVT